jgi:hypothetical protein
MSKVHFAIQYLPKENEIKSHFKTSCGIKKHIFSNVDSTIIISQVTCSKCKKLLLTYIK